VAPGNVVQCGYGQGGQTLAATALLEADRSPDEAAVGQPGGSRIQVMSGHPPGS
jgi:aerobic-type carbon monoxide dehydrogenase small subunit (CoxS/CutS family)